MKGVRGGGDEGREGRRSGVRCHMATPTRDCERDACVVEPGREVVEEERLLDLVELQEAARLGLWLLVLLVVLLLVGLLRFIKLRAQSWLATSAL